VPYLSTLPVASLATDAQGNVYFSDWSSNAVRRFPTGSCFAVPAPHLSGWYTAQPPAPLSPQPRQLLSATTGTPWFAPGELISLFGTGLGPKNGVTALAGSNGRFSTQ